MPDDVDAVVAEFDDLASWCENSSPLYERLCEIAASDEFLLDVAANHTPGQPAPQLLLAAVQAELFASGETDDRGTVDGALAAYYPSVVDDPQRPDDHLAAAFRAFVDAHEDAIRDRVSTRRVQTNAVRRCTALYPGYATVAERAGEPLAVLEVGSSAGLNLNWDRYRYGYRTAGGDRGVDGDESDDGDDGDDSEDGDAGGEGGERVVGAADSPVTIESELRGDAIPPLPDSPPAVADRVGLDLNPLDPTDADDARWLRALVWPEHRDRRRVLDGALAVARDHPPDVVQGDAVADLAAVADRLPANRPLVVSHSLVLYQLDDDARQAFYDAVADLAAARDAPTFHLAGERPDPDRDNGMQLRLARIDDAPADDPPDVEHIGTFEQHGAWIAWRNEDDRERVDADGPSTIHEDP